MMMNTRQKLLRHTRGWILFFMLALVFSGITAFAVEKELQWLISSTGMDMGGWMHKVLNGVKQTNTNYPFIAYGFDWLAFAHIVIAVIFIGPFIDPVKNIWIIKSGIISSLLIFPLAFIAGYIRQIPIGWQLIDCCFGLLALIPLFIIHYNISRLIKLKNI